MAARFRPPGGPSEVSDGQVVRIIPEEDALSLVEVLLPAMVQCRKDRVREESFCSVCVEYRKDAVRPPKEG